MKLFLLITIFVVAGQCRRQVCRQKNEIYKDCGPDVGCEASCDRPAGTFFCATVCRKGCFCKDGYVRDSNNQCIPIENCPKIACSLNETFASCSGFCYESNCMQLGEPVAMCMPSLECTAGCVCNSGFYRNDQGTCVAAVDCPPQNCLENQVWSQCDKNCDRRCSHILEPLLDCFMTGCNPGCICADGYYRDQSDTCIPRDQCPEAQLEPKVL